MNHSELGDAGTDETNSSPVPAVQLSGITKRFGAVVACDGVDLVLARGRIHGLLGENGAGKSTLMKMLIGLVLPDSGTVSIDGTTESIHDPLTASSLGIGMVHQHFSLVDALTVWENVALGDAGRLDPNATRNRIGEIAEQYGLVIDPDKRVGDLTAGLRQRVEIIKCLRRDPSIVIFDEPTSVLTPEESEQLFESLRHVVAAESRAVVLVSHKLDEVLHATDDITIMRQGKVVDQRRSVDADAPTLARAMVGREVSLRSERAALGIHSLDDTDVDDVDPVETDAVLPATAQPVLCINEAVAHDADGVVALDEFSLEMYPGEIVGVAGVEGNGQRALGDVLSSLLTLSSGTVVVDRTEVPTGRSGAMAEAGIGVIPEDRHDSGLVLDMTVAENLVLVDQSRAATRGLIDQKRLNAFALEMIDQFSIACSGPNAPMWSVSGGNQQRVVLARELSQAPKILVAAQPTRGLDVGAIEYMSHRLEAAAASGVAVLLISSELEEILELSHRIIVMHSGRIAGTMSRAEANFETLGLLMGGAAA
ncbi:MAG: ABC transporter ATP-binding protein [Acidimicrobiaceae bacterium]|nr:ABC transporter ATP-binding protein [Acidimicrobiaceae bacterium]MXW61813.1 ABC transporter ATP-binding protein [Acidimicrobiaceae bacterium]MXW76307.1 ABC transporter ATP-binding protein [Acidimicrobiaceae bacterium]MYC42972.1 ABC transporter ATP-binding protein [Acidimicrobiaceae bacterium]MYD07514.1 ABC transporter ATP-binding protein [Acidimicrobiaceae bacterium]